MHCNYYRTLFAEYTRKHGSRHKGPISRLHCGKGGKNTVLKATVGVGGPCGPAIAAKDTAKNAVGLDKKT